MAIKKSLLAQAGYQIPANPPTYREISRQPWQSRGVWYQGEDGIIYRCTFRCLSSYWGGGTCQCNSHSPEEWEEVVEG